MPAKPPINRQKRFLKLSIITFGIIAILIAGLHIWFVNNARRVIIETVSSKSNGKLKLELSQISYNFLSSQLTVKKAHLISTDSVSQPVTYSIRFDRLSIKIGSFWPLLLDKEISIDSVEILNPRIAITQWWVDSTRKQDRQEISIPRQMGKLYNSMLDGLDAFGIQRIKIDNASLTLLNKLKPLQHPVIITGIDFDLVSTADRSKKRDEFIRNEQSVDLTTSHQNMALPGGRHRLSFRSFHLNLFNKRIELDSCTVTAIAKDSMKSSYTIFFDKLLLVGVDFDAMYRFNLIKADSVYCEKPVFDININTLSVQPAKKERPNPEKIIQELTGDLDLAYVGVKNAGIKINITGSKNRSLFNSNKDDFEMRGLKIYADSARPVVIDRFDMLVRNYHLYNEDSSAAYTFDSIHFLNNKISLSNFSVITSSSPGKARSERDFKVPYFELTGLDWYQLIFEENIVAQEAVLYNPVIRYVHRNTNKARAKKTNIFKSLRLLDNLITLDRISLVNGQLDMKLNPSTSLKIKDANISLNNITEDFTALRDAVSRLSFSNAIFINKDITAIIQNAAYSGKELIHADNIQLTGKSNSIYANINDVFINNLLINENSETIVVDGLKWKSARVSLNLAASAKGKKSATQFNLSNIEGNNTRLEYSNGVNTISTGIQSLRLASLIKNISEGVRVKGLFLMGNNLDIAGDGLHMKASAYEIETDGISRLTDLDLSQVKNRDTISLKAPLLRFSTYMNEIISGDIHLGEVQITRPALNVINRNKPLENDTAQNASFRIDKLMAFEPEVQVSIHENDSVTLIHLPFSENSQISTSQFLLNEQGIQIGDVSLQTHSATLVKKTGEVIGVEDGKVDLNLSQVRFSNDKELPSWSLVVDRLDLVNPNHLSFGNNNTLQLKETSIGNFNLSSGSVNNIGRLLKDNISAWMKSTTGIYRDSNSIFQWFNAEYNSDKKRLFLDSFQYHPAKSLDSVMAHAEFQKDYITLKTGPIVMNGFNPDRFEKDSSLIADTILVHHPFITVYRDKVPPFLAGQLKPMPVDMIRNISMPVDVNNLKIVDGLLEYTERNAKTRAEGTLSLTKIDGQVSNIQNRGLNDSDSLTITMNALLMDSALLNLVVKESYTDSLGGFVMTLLLKPTRVALINPVLVPFSNVMITSGKIDSFRLRAIGYEDIAIGEMQMYYHNLRIRLIKDGDLSKTSFSGRMANFLVNAFVIRKNNRGRTGLVYYERAKDRSFFNYLVKMTFSGMATSIGVKKNKKYIRQYRQELKQRNTEPIMAD